MLRIRMVQPAILANGMVTPLQFKVVLGEAAFCVVADRYLVTAFHVLNGGQPRNLQERFYVFAVPGNGDPAFNFSVISFLLERPALDIAVIEIDPNVTPSI